jgi:hypothetical protein
MQIIKCRERIVVTTYYYRFEDRKISGAGLQFPCDKDGKIDEAALPEPALKNLKMARMMPDLYLALGPQEYTHSYIDPAMGHCDGCGCEVHLYGNTNTCACGLEYNMSGQRLAPREQWEEYGYEDDTYHDMYDEADFY